MSEGSERYCPTCGTTVHAGQRFCNNCGTDLSVSGPARQYGGQPPQNFPPPMTQPAPPYVPPAPQQQQWQVPPYAQGPQQVPLYAQQQTSNPIAEALGALGLLFFLRRFRPGYVPRRQNSGCCGCLFALVILLLIFGIPAYVASKQYISQIQQQVQNLPNNNGGQPTTQPPITTTPLNETVTYAGVQITILNAQQSSTFIDDSFAHNNGMLRLNIKETNARSNGDFAYSDAARLILPDKSEVSPTNEQNAVSAAEGTTHNNWLDFAVPTGVNTGQITLRLGTPQQAQMDIPLTARANLSDFQPRTSQPNASTPYDGLTWTVTAATLEWSSNAQQAPSGMRYVVVTLKVDNPSANEFNAYYGDYIRLKAGDTTSAPTTDTTLPLSFASGSTGSTGTVIFQVPAGVSSYTLIFLGKPQNSPPVSQATLNFQI